MSKQNAYPKRHLECIEIYEQKDRRDRSFTKSHIIVTIGNKLELVGCSKD